MKKIALLILGAFPLLILNQACCPDNGSSLTTVTIENARVLFFSFQESGVFPNLDTYNRKELGIAVGSDSISEFTQYYSMRLPSLISSAYACQNPHRTEYANYIDSLNFFTKYAFNDNYPAGANINKLLLGLDILGETYRIDDMSEMNIARDGYFKFNQTPAYDSMQFIITGRIIDKGDFEVETSLVVLAD